VAVDFSGKYDLVADAMIIPLIVCMGKFDIESVSMVSRNSVLMMPLSQLLDD
jgi:hypothetical protein